jgi:hypothetical protein
VRKFKWQIVIIVLGLVALGMGIWTMLQIPTLILPPWYLVIIFLPFVLLISIGLGYQIKKVVKSKWHTMSFASIILTIICLTFYLSKYRKQVIITVPVDYAGEVRLFLSNNEENKLNINEFGIGYLNENTYENGFRPIIMKNEQDITEFIKGYSIGEFTLSQLDNYRLEYLQFTVPKNNENEYSDAIELNELIKRNALDTALLKKK